MTSLDPSLRALAESQHGLFLTSQANALGTGSRLLTRLVETGQILHPGRGLYVVGSPEAASDEERHRQLCRGAMLMYDDAVLTGASALLAFGVPVWGAPLVRPRLLRPVDRHASVRCFWTRPARAGLVTVPSELGPCVPVADALVQHAMDAGTVPGVVSADAALRMRLVTPDEIDKSLDTVRMWPRSSRARSMVALTDGRRESVGESRTAVILATHRIEVEPQPSIYDAEGMFVARPDFHVTGTMVLIEFDGRMKYTSEDDLWAEKRREDLLRGMGYVVVRIVWSDLEHPGAVAAKVRAGIALAEQSVA